MTGFHGILAQEATRMTHAPILGRRAAGVTVLALLAGCGPLPPVPTAELPGASGGAVLLDPARQAILHSAHAFASARPMAGRPWEAAQAISEVEFLAVELRYNSRWQAMSALVPIAFEQARPEWRAAVGIDPAATAQAVIDAMTRLRQAYGAQDTAGAAAALQPPLVTPGGADALARLSALPRLPRTGQAASMAEGELWRLQRQDGRMMWWM
jgi:hypothetical protein